jgi:nicotinamidase-related amidase
MDTALILIDIQNDYFPGGRYELHESEEAAIQAARVLSRFRENGMPVFHVQHISLKPGAAFFLPDTAGAEIRADVLPQHNEPVVVKHAPDSFLNTSLESMLQEKGIKKLIVCGMMSHMCIDSTVRSAKRLGYEVTLLADACATRELVWEGMHIPAPTVHAAFMAAIDGSFAQVMTTEAYLRS